MRNPAKRCMQWLAPAIGWAKVNSDAAYMPDSGQCWAGAVARDHNGRVFLSTSKALNQASSAEEAEGQAALVGLMALAKVYRGRVELETDCKIIADAVNADVTNRSPCYGILLVLDIKTALAGFQEYRVLFAPRECNRVAHELAADARRGDEQLVIANVPDRLRSLVQSECIQA